MAEHPSGLNHEASQSRRRLMPRPHWDWHIATPFSQGLRVGNLIFVGGQLSADQDGNVLGEGDIELQTRNVFDNVTRVLREGGADWSHVVKMNTYYRCEEVGPAAQQYWEKISRIRFEYLTDPGPVGTALRVDGLMYDGFLIEVDAVAIVPEEANSREPAE